jgi:hypothetical protein
MAWVLVLSSSQRNHSVNRKARSQAGVVGVGSAAGVQIRVQSGGSMADETIVRFFSGN